MKKIFLSMFVLLGLQSMVFAIEEIPTWNDFAPSVIKSEHQSYWDARYREFESGLNDCKALPVSQRSTCFNQLKINEREKNNSFYANPSTITANSSVNEVRSTSFSLSLGYPIAYGYGYRYWNYPECVIFPSFSYVRHHRVPPPPVRHHSPVHYHHSPHHVPHHAHHHAPAHHH